MVNRKPRGIKCSRSKLDAALAASSITKKTQIALAEAVADAEKLDSVPKDLISKMFRQLPVDSQTIERVAAILGVHANSLYLDSPEEQGTQYEKKPETNIITYRISTIAIGFIAFVSIVGLIYFQFGSSSAQSECLKPVSFSAGSPNKLRIIIGRFKGDHNNQAQFMLASQLASNSKFSQRIDVFTSCFANAFNASESIREQMRTAHKRAKQELKDYHAQLMLWGERYDNRLNIRFSSEGSASQIKNLILLNKTISVNELDFSFNLGIGDIQAIANDLPLLSLSMLSPSSKKFLKLKEDLIKLYNYSGNWLKEAVSSELNLLQRISLETEPVVYRLTLTQLCYRQRLLGDLEASLSYYNQAENSCREVISLTDKTRTPLQWATLTSNLATVMIRKHLYVKKEEDRRALLYQSKLLFESVKDIFIRDINPVEAGTYYQNYAAVFIRLAELEPKKMNEYLNQAMEYSRRSLEITRPEDNPVAYAQKLQNQCSLKYRLGLAEEDTSLVISANEDCQQAKSLVDNEEHPRQWAMIQNNLAISFAILAELSNNSKALKKALDSFDTAQQVYSKKRYPVNWAEVEINKAELKCKLGVMDNEKSHMLSAKQSAESALIIFIENEIKAYQAYAENLIAKISYCDLENINHCKCSN